MFNSNAALKEIFRVMVENRDNMTDYSDMYSDSMECMEITDIEEKDYYLVKSAVKSEMLKGIISFSQEFRDTDDGDPDLISVSGKVRIDAYHIFGDNSLLFCEVFNEAGKLVQSYILATNPMIKIYATLFTRVADSFSDLLSSGVISKDVISKDKVSFYDRLAGLFEYSESVEVKKDEGDTYTRVMVKPINVYNDGVIKVCSALPDNESTIRNMLYKNFIDLSFQKPYPFDDDYEGEDESDRVYYFNIEKQFKEGKRALYRAYKSFDEENLSPLIFSKAEKVIDMAVDKNNLYVLSKCYYIDADSMVYMFTQYPLSIIEERDTDFYLSIKENTIIGHLI